MRKYYNKYNFVHGCLRNVGNVLRFGLSAPKVAERIWVNTKQCEKILDGEVIREIFRVSNMRYVSGLVVNSEWPIEKSCNVSEVSIIKDCIMHWVDGVSWENTGAYERMMKRIDQKGKADGCKNLIDVRNRYRNLDVIYSQIKKEGLFRAGGRLKLFNPWLHQDAVFHFGPNGELFFGGGAYHRYAIAFILDIILPARIGCVHVSAIPYLNEFRNYKADQKTQKD